MEGLGVASSVIAVVDLSAKVASLCLQYSKEVKHAAETINLLHSQVDDLRIASASLLQLLDGPKGSNFDASQQLRGTIDDGLRRLQSLHETLRPKTARQAMSRLGLRSLKWPFERADVEKQIQHLKQFTQTISLALQIDAVNVLLDVDQTIVLDRLRIAEGAAFDSHAQEHDRLCLLNTRVELLQQIADWAIDINAEPIFWLSGMAGTGKSTISRTIAHTLATKGHLGASFFFKKGEADRGNLTKFFMTLAAGLVERKPSVTPHIKAALESDRSIVTKNAGEQFNKLLLEPLLKSATEDKPIVIIVDALDECERDDDVRLVLHLFSRFKTELPQRVRVFVTSRPELPIRCGFTKLKGAYQGVILHEMPLPVVEHDISVFLKHELARIREDYNDSVTDQHLSADWPSQSNFDYLLEMSVPLFIVATTICLFINDIRIGPPKRQLETVLSRVGDGVSQLERTYRPILDSLTEGVPARQQGQVLDEFRRVVGTIILLASPLSVTALAKLLGMSRDDIDARLALLHSLLSVPPSAEVPIRMLHLSFRDFLLDPDEPEMPFRINEKQTHADLAAHCLRVLSCLEQDVCRLGVPGTPRSAVSDLQINKHLPQEVQYACLYWIYHIDKAEIHISDASETYTFLVQHFLHWIEALTLIGRGLESLDLLRKLQSRVQNTNSTQISLLLEDATRFIQAYMPAINSTPLQLYSSLLIFSPEHSILRTTFANRVDEAKLVCIKSQIDDNWSPCLQTLEGHTDKVRSVTFSHTSAFVASASDDNTVRIWRTDTGECIQILRGHSRAVLTVVFSQDSRLIASASEDTTVRIWHAHTGECMQTLEGHTDKIEFVAFSPDSTLIASASFDTTIRIWRIDTGECVQTLNDHDDWVLSVAFSKDSALIISASVDKTRRIWRTNTGECIQKLEGYSDRSQSVAFIEDAALATSTSPSYDKMLLSSRADTGLSVAFSRKSSLVSICSDETVQIWHADSGQCVQTLTGHTGFVGSLAFSHNLPLMASASDDKTVRIWRVDDGQCLQAPEVHSRSVQSVAFRLYELVASDSNNEIVWTWHVDRFPSVQPIERHANQVHMVALSRDSALVASASEDATVRIWCTSTGKCIQTLRGHDYTVWSAAFSQDSTLVASASFDSTLRIWHTHTGKCLQTLEVPKLSRRSAIFSPDSTLVISLSHDDTPRIWRVDTGECVQTLQGHTGWVPSAAFSDDSKLVVSGSWDKTVRIWCISTGKCTQVLTGHTDEVASVVFSRNSSLLASTSKDKTVRIWRADTGDCVQTLKGHSDWVESVAFSQDSLLVASTSEDKTVRIWRVSTGECVQAASIDCASQSLSFSRDDSHVLTDVGAIAANIGSPAAMPTPATYPGISISTDNSWITWKGTNLVWLPIEFRPCCSAVSESVVVIGSSLGRVTILRPSSEQYA